MSKARGVDADADASPRDSADGVLYVEDQPLRSASQEISDEDTQLFASSHNLLDELPTIAKAAALVNSDDHGDVHSSLSDLEKAALQRQSTHQWSQPRTLYFTIGVCALGAIEQGMAQTGINGANLYLPAALDIDSGSTSDAFVLGLINCGLYLANGLCGAWLAQPVNDRLGRRGAIFVGTALCLAGNLFSAISWTWPLLLSSRVVLGLGMGLNASTVAVFAAESAPAYIRGGLAVSWQMFTAFGILIGFLANVAFFDYGPDVIWRLQLGAPIIPTMPLLMLIYLCPESPAWLMQHGRYDLAFESLAKLRNTKLQAAAELYSDYIVRRRSTKTFSDDPITFLAKFRSLFTVSRNRHAVYASSAVMLTQQLCGINIVAFYSSTLFSSSGFSTFAALWASCVFGLVNFLGAFPAVFTMDAFGRRKLLLWTLPFMALTLALTSLSFGLPKGNAKLVLLAGLIYLFCAIYSPGAGPVPMAYSAEVYPSSVREIGMSFAVSTANLWAAVLSVTFPPLLDGLGERGSFALYAALNVVAWLLCWTFVRETKGVELEKMAVVFESSPASFIAEKWEEGPARWMQSKRLRQGWRQVQQDEDAE